MTSIKGVQFMNVGKILFDSGNTIPKSTRYLEPV